jgi:hypothetical protein
MSHKQVLMDKFILEKEDLVHKAVFLKAIGDKDQKFTTIIVWF